MAGVIRTFASSAAPATTMDVPPPSSTALEHAMESPPTSASTDSDPPSWPTLVDFQALSLNEKDAAYGKVYTDGSGTRKRLRAVEMDMHIQRINTERLWLKLNAVKKWCVRHELEFSREMRKTVSQKRIFVNQKRKIRGLESDLTLVKVTASEQAAVICSLQAEVKTQAVEISSLKETIGSLKETIGSLKETIAEQDSRITSIFNLIRVNFEQQKAVGEAMRKPEAK